jgi:hypothetical protein
MTDAQILAEYQDVTDSYRFERVGNYLECRVIPGAGAGCPAGEHGELGIPEARTGRDELYESVRLPLDVVIQHVQCAQHCTVFTDTTAQQWICGDTQSALFQATVGTVPPAGNCCIFLPISVRRAIIELATLPASDLPRQWDARTSITGSAR